MRKMVIVFPFKLGFSPHYSFRFTLGFGLIGILLQHENVACNVSFVRQAESVLLSYIQHSAGISLLLYSAFPWRFTFVIFRIPLAFHFCYIQNSLGVSLLLYSAFRWRFTK